MRRLRGAAGEDLGGYRYTAFGKAYPADTSTPAPSLDQPLRWKGRWFAAGFAGGTYDIRARPWSPDLGAFLQGDEFALLRTDSTLWGWPGQNPLRWRDPTGRDGYILGGQAQLTFGPGAGGQVAYAHDDNNSYSGQVGFASAGVAGSALPEASIGVFGGRFTGNAQDLPNGSGLTSITLSLPGVSVGYLKGANASHAWIVGFGWSITPANLTFGFSGPTKVRNGVDLITDFWDQ